MSTNKAKQIAQNLGLNITLVNEALGIRPKITTVNEASKAYSEAIDGSDTKIFALKRWQQLSLIEAELASTLNEAKKAFETAPRDSDAEEIAILKWIDYCCTIDEIKSAYFVTRIGTEINFLASTKWIGFCNTLSEFQEVSVYVTNASEPQRLMIRRMAELLPD